jgi:hypothetical protein
MKVFISADKLQDNLHHPSEWSGSVYDLLSGTEYVDVLEGEVQIWEYPSGNIYDVKPDRTVPEKDHYSTSGAHWQPKIILATTDARRVENAYIQLTSPEQRTALIFLDDKLRKLERQGYQAIRGMAEARDTSTEAVSDQAKEYLVQMRAVYEDKDKQLVRIKGVVFRARELAPWWLFWKNIDKAIVRLEHVMLPNGSIKV